MVGRFCGFGVFCCGERVSHCISFSLKILCFHFKVYCLFLLCSSSAFKITLSWLQRQYYKKQMQYLHPKFTAVITQLSVRILESSELLPATPCGYMAVELAMNQVNFPPLTKAVQRCEIGNSSYYLKINTQEIQAGGSIFLSV